MQQQKQNKKNKKQRKKKKKGKRLVCISLSTYWYCTLPVLLSVTLVAVVKWTVRCLQAVTFLVLRLLLTSVDLCTAWLVLSPVPPPALITATHGNAWREWPTLCESGWQEWSTEHVCFVVQCLCAVLCRAVLCWCARTSPVKPLLVLLEDSQSLC